MRFRIRAWRVHGCRGCYFQYRDAAGIWKSTKQLKDLTGPFNQTLDALKMADTAATGRVPSMGGFRSIVLNIVAVLSCTIIGLGQTGTMQGTVTDRSGAFVQGAEITVRNLATNAKRVVTSGSMGDYAVTNLPIGQYEVIVKKASFKTLHVDSANITVGDMFTVNARLDVGVVTEEVKVRGDELPGVDLETSQVSNVVDQRKMADLPLIVRDPYQLVLLSPGTVQSNSGLGGFSVNGSRERDNNFLLDGSDNNDASVPGGPGGLASLNPDATEEFRVITNNFMPEYGRNNGAIVDVVTKSGTNEFHGDARWFGRYNVLGARDYFNHLASDGTLEKQNPYVRNQFGFNLGGPILKNKTFFFIDNEWQRFRTTLTNTSTVPTAAFKSGVFNYLDSDPNDCTPNPAPCTFPIDLSASSPNNANGLPFDPLTSQILSVYPNPNAGAVDSIRGNLNFPSSSRQDAWNFSSKMDHKFTDNESLSIHYAYDTFKDPDLAHDDFLPGIGATGGQGGVQVLGARLTSTLRTTLVNEAKFGYNRADFAFKCGTLNVINSFGAKDAFGRSRDFVFNDLSGFGCFTLADSDGEARRTGTWSAGDNVSWVKGSHTMKFGGDYRRVFGNGFNSFGSRDSVTFTGFLNFNEPFVNVNPALPPCDPSNPTNPDDRF